MTCESGIATQWVIPALLAMSCYAGAYDAGAAMVGTSNLATFLEKTAHYRRALRTPE